MERERKVSRGMEGARRGEARQKCVDFYFVTSLRAIRIHIREIHTLVVDTTPSIVKFIDR